MTVDSLESAKTLIDSRKIVYYVYNRCVKIRYVINLFWLKVFFFFCEYSFSRTKKVNQLYNMQ